MKRWKPAGADPFLDARQVGDAAMYSVNYEQRTAKQADPHHYISLPPIACHIICEAVYSQVIRLVVNRVECPAALPIDCS
jgi:hypothetical protein